MSQPEKSREELQKEIEMLMLQVNEMSVSAHSMIQAQSHLESVLHHAGEGVILYNPDSTIKSLNLAAQKIFGYQEIDLMYQFAPQIFNAPEEYKESVPAYLKKHLAEHPDTSIEPLYGRNAGGKFIPLQISISEVAVTDMVFFDDFSDEQEDENNENFELFACLIHDLSNDIKAKQLLEEKNQQLEQAYVSLSEHDRQRSEFMAKVSHELLTPLNGIIGMSDILQDEVQQEQQEFVQVIKESGLRLEGIISNILAFDHNEDMSAEETPLSLIDLFNTLESDFSGVLSEKELSLSISVDDRDNMPEFYVFYDQLKHILSNLLDNAIKFTHTGDVQILCVIAEHDEDHRKVNMIIKDTGIGIDPADFEKIFHPFTQLEDTVTRKFGGVGMGLAIVKQLMKSMDGQLELDSQPGQGTSVCLNFIFQVVDRQKRSHTLVDEEKLSQLRQIMEDDFGLLIETSMSELQSHFDHLSEYIINKDRKNAFASMVMLMNICDQVGAQYLINLLQDFQKMYENDGSEDDLAKKIEEHQGMIREEIELVIDMLKHI